MGTFMLSGTDRLLSPLTSCSLSGLTPLHGERGSWWDKLIPAQCPHFPYWAPLPTLKHCLFVILHTVLTHSLPCSLGRNNDFEIEKDRKIFNLWVSVMPTVILLITGYRLVGVIFLWSIGINGGFGLQQCVGVCDKESFVSSVPTVCYGIIFTGTVFFWLCPPHLRSPFSTGSTLWSGCLETHTQTNSWTTHTSDHVVMSDKLILKARFNLSLFCVFWWFLYTVCFIPKTFHSLQVHELYLRWLFFFFLSCPVVLSVNCHELAHPVIWNAVRGWNSNCTGFTYFIIVLVK